MTVLLYNYYVLGIFGDITPCADLLPSTLANFEGDFLFSELFPFPICGKSILKDRKYINAGF